MLMLVAMGALCLACASPGPAAPTPRPRPTYAPEPAEVCAESVPSGSGQTTQLSSPFYVPGPTFAICFPRAGGAVEGKVELVVTSSDDDCFGRISANGTMTGAFSGAARSGSSQEVATIALQGVCDRERALLDPSTTRSLPPWQGTFDGTTLHITLPADPDDPTEVVTLDGRPR